MRSALVCLTLPLPFVDTTNSVDDADGKLNSPIVSRAHTQFLHTEE